MTTISRNELISKLQDLRPMLRSRGVVGVTLFGSRARGDNRADSDIDLVIDVDEALSFSLLDLVGVGHEIEDRLHLPANLFMRRSLDVGFHAEASRDGLVIYS